MSAFWFGRPAILAAGALAMAGAAHAEIFMKVSDTPGDASTRGFEQQITLTGASLSISNSLTADPSARSDPEFSLNVTPVSITKDPDRSSPKLMLDAVKGKPLGTIEITFTSQPKPGMPQMADARWILEGAEVRSFQIFPGADRSAPPVETAEITFKTMRYQRYVLDAKGVRTGAMEEVKWDAPADNPFADDSECR